MVLRTVAVLVPTLYLLPMLARNAYVRYPGHRRCA